MPITTATHATYKRRKADWMLVRRMLTTEEVTAELTQRYFEHDEHFRQRRKDSRGAEPLTSYLLTRLAGILFQQEADVARDLGPVLTAADFEAAGPDGEDYRIVLMQLAAHLLAYDEALVIVNPRRGLEVRSPLIRPHWTDATDTITGSRMMGTDPAADVKEVKTWTVYRPNGYETYRKGKENEPDDVLIESGPWADGEPFFVDEAGTPTTPVLHVRVPWNGRLGWLIAKKHREIYEIESRRDFALSSAMNGLIQIGTGGDADLSDLIKDQAKRGAKMLPYDRDLGEHKGLEMPTSGAQLGGEVLQDKRKALRRVAYDTLNEAARQTATQAQIEQQGGAAAALSVLAETMADAEARILHLWTQARDFRYAGPDPRPTDVACTWPTDYSTVFDESTLAQRVFGSTLPVDVDTATDVLVATLEAEGVAVDDERRQALQARVQAKLDRETQAADAGGLFG